MDKKTLAVIGAVLIVGVLLLLQITSGAAPNILWYNCQQVSNEVIMANSQISINNQSCSFITETVSDPAKFSFGGENKNTPQVSKILFDNSCRMIEKEISPYKQPARDFEGLYQNSEGNLFWCVGFSSGT